MFNNAQKISRSQLKHFFFVVAVKIWHNAIVNFNFLRSRPWDFNSFIFFVSKMKNWKFIELYELRLLLFYFIWGTVTLFSFYYAYDHKFLLLFVILFTNRMFAFKKRVSEWMEREILVYCKVRQFPLGFCLCFIVLGVWIVDGEEKKLNGSDWDDELEL